MTLKWKQYPNRPDEHSISSGDVAEARIAALVAHLDAVTVVPTPTPVVTDTDVSNALATGQ